MKEIKLLKLFKKGVDKCSTLWYNEENETKEVIKMNAEIEKAIAEKQKKHPVRKWWDKNGYKVMRVILFLIWGCICAKNKIENHLNSKCEWSEERANKILSYYIPRKAKWHEDEKCFYFVDSGMGWGMSYNKKFIMFRDR